MNIHEFTDYKKYFNSWVKSLPKDGRGEYRRVAEKLGVSTTMISQVFNGDKHLNLELASDLCDYLNLEDRETDYFFLLVEYARAGTYKLQQKLIARIKAAQNEAQTRASRLKNEKELTEDARAVFYSSWIYSAVRHLAALPTINDVQAIAERLNLPVTQVQRVLDFLVSEGLVLQESKKLQYGPRRTHLAPQSPLVSKHHQNWRILGFQKMVLTEPNNLFYTAPMSMSEETARVLRTELPLFIEKIDKLVVPSPSEVTRCLNIDWFEF